MVNSKSLYIVHCIDTEGPLYESLGATFERLNNILGLKIEASKANLEKIQKLELDLNGVEAVASKIVSKDLLNYNDTWDKIDEMLEEMLSETFRNNYRDSLGNGWVYNWFIVDHVGYDINPRRRDIGYHNIYDHYISILKETKSLYDEINWHFHPMSMYKEAHMCATSFLRSPHLLETLTRRIIDKVWFPKSFRAGFHTERPDSHWFLEQWIPFDFSNQAMPETENDKLQNDISAGRFGDWRRARSDWGHYSPSHEDYQVQGNCNRTIFRCLNIGTRLRLLDEQEVERAFARANEGLPTILAFTNHDFRDMRPDVENVYQMITKVADRYPEVNWINSGANDAAIKVLDLKCDSNFVLEAKFEKCENYVRLIVESNQETFGPQPFLSIKTLDNRYLTDNFDFQIPKRKWSYTFDTNTLRFDSIDKIGIASNDKYGNTFVAVYDRNGELICNNQNV